MHERKKLNKWLILAKLGKSSKWLTCLSVVALTAGWKGSGFPESALAVQGTSTVGTRAPINLCMVSLFLASLELLAISAVDWTLLIYSELNVDVTGIGYMLACLE